MSSSSYSENENQLDTYSLDKNEQVNFWQFHRFIYLVFPEVCQLYHEGSFRTVVNVIENDYLAKLETENLLIRRNFLTCPQ